MYKRQVYVFIFFMILAVVNELIMLGGGYRSKIRSAVPHTLTWMLNAMGSTLTMLLFRDSLVESYVSMGMDCLLYTSAPSLKYDRFSSSGHIIPRFFLVCDGCGEKIANQKECSVAERDDGIPVIVVAAVKETIS